MGGARGGRPLVFLDQREARRGPPLSQTLDDGPPPPSEIDQKCDKLPKLGKNNNKTKKP